LSQLSIRTRVLVILAAVAIAAAGVTAAIGYTTARDALEDQSFQKLTAVREMKASQVEDYFRTIADQAVTLSESRMIVDAARALREGFRRVRRDHPGGAEEAAARDLSLRLYYQNEFLPRLGEGGAGLTLDEYWPEGADARLLQHLYIAANPFKTGEKSSLDAAEEPSAYTRAHALYHPILRSYLNRFGYYDLFLVDPETGHIVYSVFKEVDFATSLLHGPYRETNFARAFRAARDAGAASFVRLVDFEPYTPSYGAEASFIASPIFDGPDRVGVLVLQMPLDRINDVMTAHREWERVGLGASGETYLVGEDYRLRSESRFLIEDQESFLRAIEDAGTPASTVASIARLGTAIGLQEVETEGTRAALEGETGTRVFLDYRGVPVLSAFRPLELRDLHWVIMSEIDREEAFAPVRSLRNRTLAWLAVLVASIGLVAFAFARSLTRPLEELSRSAAALAEGNLDVPIETAGHDEIARLSRSFDAMRQSLRDLVQRQERAIDALSVPLIPLSAGVVAMPLVGELDPRRLARTRETLVRGLHESGAQTALLDLTGVPHLDPESAAGLVAAARAARLLGAEVILTGIRPEIAAGLVDLDLDLGNIPTERSLESGIARAVAGDGERPGETTSPHEEEQEE
jgi:anti-anti-sigma regulatory factor/HAMP domain-containing protein